MTEVQTWADGHGNWHALVSLTGDEDFIPSMEAHRAILAELQQRQGMAIDISRFAVREASRNASAAEYVEWWGDENDVPFPDTATCGECGKTFPDIYPAARCPFEDEHQPDREAIEREGTLAHEKAMALRDAPQTHHKACNGSECEKFGCVTLAGVLDELKNSECTFWACEGPDVEPVMMVTCSLHWAYYDLKGIVR